MKDFFTSPKYKRLLMWVGSLVALLVSFQAGMFVGFHKAGMAFHFDGQYGRAYGEHFRSGPFGIAEDDFPEAHGAIGRVLSINLPTIVIEDKNIEKIVRIDGDTTVKKGRTKLDVSTIKLNDFLVVIGSPNDKEEVAAKFIRILPPPPGFSTTTLLLNSSSTVK